MQDPDDLVDGALVERKPRDGGGDEDLRQPLERLVGVRRDHVHSRRHHAPNLRVAEVDHSPDQLAVGGLEDSLLRPDVDERFDLLFARFVVCRRRERRRRPPPRGERSEQDHERRQHGERGAVEPGHAAQRVFRVAYDQRAVGDLGRGHHDRDENAGQEPGRSEPGARERPREDAEQDERRQLGGEVEQVAEDFEAGRVLVEPAQAAARLLDPVPHADRSGALEQRGQEGRERHQRRHERHRDDPPGQRAFSHRAR